MANKSEKIAVLGAGTMGAGIAQVSAQAGYETLIYDVKPEF
ncbi:MAG: 3-hydroxybutyryl-CoA dehydrogenase, partial [Deltaproteobacteria bacterium]